MSPFFTFVEIIQACWTTFVFPNDGRFFEETSCFQVLLTPCFGEARSLPLASVGKLQWRIHKERPEIWKRPDVMLLYSQVVHALWLDGVGDLCNVTSLCGGITCTNIVDVICIWITTFVWKSSSSHSGETYLHLNHVSFSSWHPYNVRNFLCSNRLSCIWGKYIFSTSLPFSLVFVTVD